MVGKRAKDRTARYENLGFPLRIFPHEKSNEVFWGSRSGRRRGRERRQKGLQFQM